MPIIRPISHLKTKTHEIRELAQVSQEPIFLTKRGYGYVVVMSLAYYRQRERNIARLENRLIARAPAKGCPATRHLTNKVGKRNGKVNAKAVPPLQTKR